MKINPNLDPQASQGLAGTGSAGAPSAQSGRASQSTQTPASDKADLSSEAQQFALLSGQLSTIPDTRQERVASLKAAVQNGSYTATNQQIAQSMIRDFDTVS